MNSERFRTWAGLVIVSTVWGSTWLAIKVGLTSVPPFFGAGVRFVIAAAVIYVIIRVRSTPVPFTPDAKKLYAVLSIMSYTIPFGLVYWAQQFIPSGLSSVLFACYPFWVAIFSQMLLSREPLNVFKVSGIILGFLGIVIIFSEDIHFSRSAGFLGMSAILLVAALQGLSTVLIKKWGEPISPFSMNLVGMSVGAVCLLALSLSTESLTDIIWDEVAIGSILYLALFGSVLTFVTYFWLLKRIQAVYLSLTSFINPIVAVILGSIFLKEALAPTVFVGASCVLFGILVANGKYLYERIKEPA